MPQNKEHTMTVPRFKAWLRSQGKTIRQWSEENGFPPGAVYRVLNGVDKAHFGRAHDIAIAAGIKPPADKLAA
jgi:gp16 family phage-associated protein